MKILLLGATGQVGTECLRSLAPLGELVVATRSGSLPDGTACEVADFDVPDSLATLVGNVGPDVVVNAAAYTAVDLAESEREMAWRVNAEAPGVLARACASRDALLVHYSTDYVFDGAGSRPYREDDPTAPLGVYGESKLAGEKEIRASEARHLILRTAWVYAAHGKNFLRTMLRLGSERETLRVVSDQVGSPTSAGLIADTTARLLAMPGIPEGVRHLTSSGETSWHGFATAIFAYAREQGLLARVPNVEPISTREYPTPAKRPAYSVLDGTRLAMDLGESRPEWGAELERVIGAIGGRR